MRLPRGATRKKDGVSDRVPQHDPPPEGELVQPEVDERDDTILVEGDDADHVLPPTELDPYTPEAAPAARARAAMGVALGLVAVLIVVVILAALR